MTDTLKPCPFCGGKSRYYYEKGNDSIVCEECGAKLTYLDFGDPNDELVKQWNTRQVEDAKLKYEPTSYSCRACKNATDEEIKRLREALEEIKEVSSYMCARGATIYDLIGIHNICCDALEGKEE